jgi:hypothetical protein
MMGLGTNPDQCYKPRDSSKGDGDESSAPPRAPFHGGAP